MKLIKTNIPGYFKDESTGAVINKNEDQYNAYEAQIRATKQNKMLEEELILIKAQLAQLMQLVCKKD
jgi:hypothetical protein